MNASSNSTCNAPSWKYGSFEQSFLEWITEVNLDEILNPTDVTSKLEALAATKLSLSEEREEMQRELDTLIERIGQVDDLLFDAVKRRASVVKKELDDLKVKFLTCEEEENRLRSAQTQGLTSEIFTKFTQAQSELTPEERRDLRVQIHKHMQDQIEVITIHNKPDQIFPFDDLEELLPSGFIEVLRKEGVQVGDPTKLEEFVATEKGRRRLEVYQRYFSVKFRNGTVKRVQPEARRAQYTVSEKMAAMRKKIADQE